MEKQGETNALEVFITNKGKGGGAVEKKNVCLGLQIP